MFHTSKTKLKNYSNTESQSEQQDPNREFKTLLKGFKYVHTEIFEWIFATKLSFK